MRTINEADEINQNLDAKIEIESCPPLNLNEDSHLESSSSNNQNNSQQTQNKDNEMCQGENLKKYNVLL